MLRSTTVSLNGRTIKHLLWIGCLVVLLGLLLPATALAEPPEPSYEGPEKCAECHAAETDAWRNSPHANAMADIDDSLQSACGAGLASSNCSCLTCHTTDFNPVDSTYVYGGVACEACHGPYVEGHPQDGMMQLDVDSSVCEDCHVETHQQWQDSSHAEAGVQCIGCHLSHSQEFRLTDETLCGSCHRHQVEDFAHTAHDTQDITCTDCHLSTIAANEATAMVSTGVTMVGGTAPSHRFTVVSSQACLNCHGETIHEETTREDLTQAANVRLLAMADRAPELASQLEAEEQANKSLRVMTFVSLGLGLGIGGMLGIIFMIVVGYISQGRAKQ